MYRFPSYPIQLTRVFSRIGCLPNPIEIGLSFVAGRRRREKAPPAVEESHEVFVEEIVTAEMASLYFSHGLFFGMTRKESAFCMMAYPSAFAGSAPFTGAKAFLKNHACSVPEKLARMFPFTRPRNWSGRLLM